MRRAAVLEHARLVDSQRKDFDALKEFIAEEFEGEIADAVNYELVYDTIGEMLDACWVRAALYGGEGKERDRFEGFLMGVLFMLADED